jgi:hypothetical protein
MKTMKRTQAGINAATVALPRNSGATGHRLPRLKTDNTGWDRIEQT